MNPVLTEFTTDMQQHGIVSTDEIIPSGEIQRFHIEGDNPTKQNGWCIIHLGPFPHGYYGSWKTGKKHCWQLKQMLSNQQQAEATIYRQELRKQHEAEKEKKYKQAAETAQLLIGQSASADPTHPYLTDKQIQPHRILQLEGVLLIPMYFKSEVVSLQVIYQDGSKRFLPGGRVAGCYFNIGSSGKQVYIAEGFATACTIHEQYNVLAVAAFTAGNLGRVSQDIALNNPGTSITVTADNDQWTEGNPGMTKAREAAGLVGGEIMWPNFDGMDISSKPTDFNDFVRLGGAL